jgi:hypothetical protein
VTVGVDVVDVREEALANASERGTRVGGSVKGTNSGLSEFIEALQACPACYLSNSYIRKCSLIRRPASSNKDLDSGALPIKADPLAVIPWRLARLNH